MNAPGEGCTQIDGLGQGINSGPTGPDAVAVTPDGRSAYVASGDSIVDSDQALSLSIAIRRPALSPTAAASAIRPTGSRGAARASAS